MKEFESTVERQGFELLLKAIHAGASDLHILPCIDGYNLFFRSHAQMRNTGKLPLHLGDRIITFFKFLSSLDISEKRKPQSGSFQHHFKNQLYSFRVSTLPSVYLKESVVIRLMLQDSAQSLTTLSINKESANLLQKLVSAKQGLICFTGPTGSGKTTTLYSLTNYSVQEMNRHVISLEDPVENNQSHLLQIQVNERSGVSYATGLKAILRHSPDIIMIGEIRDSATAQAAIQAALTGHLVLTTIHAKDTIGCLYRFLDLGISLEDLRQTILAIVAQRLVKRKDKVSIDDSTASIYEILHGNYLTDAFHALQNGDEYTLKRDLTLIAQIEEGIRNGEISSP